MQVRAERAAASLTRAQLAQSSGVPEQTLGRIERKQRVADVTQIARVCAALGLPVGEFFRRAEARR